MNLLKRLWGRTKLDGEKLAASDDLQEYAQIHLLAEFVETRPLHSTADQQRWNRVLPRPYQETIQLFQKQGWLEANTLDQYRVTPAGRPFVQRYRERLEAEKAAILPQVRQALEARDTSEALEIRRRYEARFPLGKADWTGPEPQLNHSALTRRILFLDHWLLEGLSLETVEWLKLYAAEQHLWGAQWRLSPQEIPAHVEQELATSGLDPVEATFWKAQQLILYVENHDTWQRCKGGDHVRRMEIVGPDDEHTCEHCRQFRGQEFLVARVPELPHRDCTSIVGCRCRYEPVLEVDDEDGL
ncbi:hypothetical protein RY27_05220 [Litorilinea aerophila]|nr:hypothetical protein RY27_05220 [Litorilinea aerophila]